MSQSLKYCGNQSLQDVKTVAKSKADYLGFIFTTESKRTVKATDVANWLQEVDIGNKQTVGVFVNPSYEEVAFIIREVQLDVIQLHGTESATFIKELKDKYKTKIWKALHHSAVVHEQMREYGALVDGFLIDSKVQGKWGGTGQTFAWEAVPTYMAVGKEFGVPVFVAGGVTAHNIHELLAYEPDGIDLASGIEEAGHKSATMIAQLEERMNENGKNVSR